MNKLILNTLNQQFINTHLDSDITSLLFTTPNPKLASIKDLIGQIEAKNKCKLKLPRWFQTKTIYYPDKVNIEQTSSEITAQYKASLVSGESLIDITGGFGVDAFYFAKHFNQVFHCEIDTRLSEIVRHNFKQLNVSNIKLFAGNGLNFLSHSKMKFDCIYVDPSRRHEMKGKSFFFKDCLPDITKHLNLLLQFSKTILIKGSPMLDISAGVNVLKYVKEVHVIAVNNDVKELLYVIESDYDDKIKVKTINFAKNRKEKFEFYFVEEKQRIATLSAPKHYIYECNNAIMKSGAFNSIAHTFNLKKLHPFSHLYTSDKLINFPGRCFQLIKVLPFKKKKFNKEGITKANVTVRNFPLSVIDIRKKLQIKDGGNHFLFFTTNAYNDKIILLCQKVKKP